MEGEMAIRVNELKSMSRTVKVEFFGESCDVTYALGAITTEMQDEIRLATETGDESFLIAQFRHIVTGWDVLGEDGEPLPLTEEALRPLPIPFLASVLEQVVTDRGNSPKGSNSGAGSARKAR